MRSTPTASFNKIYEHVEPALIASLQDFRQQHPPQSLNVEGVNWEYVALGKGEEAILFLHGLTGAYDIWWQQMEALQESYRLVSVTYPPVDSLGALEKGILAILQHKGIGIANVVGSSLGGYLAQYLIMIHPQIVERAIFANTLATNDRIAEKYKIATSILPYAPEWLVMAVLRASFRMSIYPASGNNSLVLAYLNEISYGGISKADVEKRYHCVIEPFNPPDAVALGIPVAIFEASNDPLIEPALREQLKRTYPNAFVVGMGDVGHFPYLSQPEMYTTWLRDFLSIPVR